MTSLIQNIRFGLAPEIGKPRTEGNYQLCLSATRGFMDGLARTLKHYLMLFYVS